MMFMQDLTKWMSMEAPALAPNLKGGHVLEESQGGIIWFRL